LDLTWTPSGLAEFAPEATLEARRHFIRSASSTLLNEDNILSTKKIKTVTHVYKEEVHLKVRKRDQRGQYINVGF